MSLTEWGLLVTTAIAVVTAVAAVFRDRKKPVLDEAQAESALVNSESVKMQIKKMSDESNIRRDLRILDLEKWADAAAPWMSLAIDRFNLICRLLREDREKLGLPMPEIDLPPAPERPAPRAL